MMKVVHHADNRTLTAGEREEFVRNYPEGIPAKAGRILLVPPGEKITGMFGGDIPFTSTWLGNKAIYRTRMAVADEGLDIKHKSVRYYATSSPEEG